MYTSDLIDAIRLPFRKDRELYRSFYHMLGFYPRHIQYYRQALMHKSMGMNVEGERPVNNERLEFLGDAVLDSVVGEIVFRHFPGKREGFLTTARSKIVKRDTLGKLAVQIGLDKLVQYQGSMQPHNSYVAGNAFEALVGAVYLDRGYNACRRFVERRILEHLIDIDKIAYQEVNFKSRLLEWTQKHRLTLIRVRLYSVPVQSSAASSVAEAPVTPRRKAIRWPAAAHSVISRETRNCMLH